MANSQPVVFGVAGGARTARMNVAAQLIPAAVWLGLLAGVLRYAGAVWDVSWHRTIGRDSFWSPPHVLLYLGVGLGLVASSWAVTEAVLDDENGSAWRRLLRTPYLLPLIGGALIVVSAPIDDGWHQLFGRDVDIWSPPHMLAVFGSALAGFGWAFALGRAQSPGRTTSRPGSTELLEWTFIGLLLYAGWFALNWYHMVAASRDALVYPTLATFVFVLVLTCAARPDARRGSRTIVATVFVVVATLPLLLFPVFGWRGPAAPPLLIVPALVLELTEARLPGANPALRAVLGAVLFAVTFVVVEALRLALVPAPAPFGEDLLAVVPYVEWARAHPWTLANVAAALPLAAGAAVAALLIGRGARRAAERAFVG